MGGWDLKHIFNEAAPFFENVKTWKRFIDDIFFIWSVDTTTLLEYIAWFNSSDINLKFTENFSTTEVEFLDILISGCSSTLEVSFFRKPMAINTILQHQSYHPSSQKDSIPFGEFLRVRRNCTNMKDLNKHGELLKKRLLDRGYPHRLVKTAFKRAKYYNRDALLQGTTREPKDQIVCVINHSQLNYKIKNIVNKHWKIRNVHKDETQLKLPLVAYRTNRNLRDVLVHTRDKIEYKNYQSTLTGLPAILGNHKCGSCHACESALVTDCWHYNGKEGKLKDQTNCRSQNIIYIIMCPCPLVYIGETGREFRVRYGEHRSAIRTGKMAASLVQHCREKNHSDQDLKCVILEKVKSKMGLPMDRTRKHRDSFWIFFP